jgi:hypothetical protein
MNVSSAFWVKETGAKRCRILFSNLGRVGHGRRAVLSGAHHWRHLTHWLALAYARERKPLEEQSFFQSFLRPASDWLRVIHQGVCIVPLCTREEIVTKEVLKPCRRGPNPRDC